MGNSFGSATPQNRPVRTAVPDASGKMKATGMDINYKELVVELMEAVNSGKESSTMLELRLSLFIAACHSTNYNTCLLPFPPCFFNAETKTKDFKALEAQINQIPELYMLDEDTDLPELTWQLLYWVFTNPLTVSPLFSTDMVLSAEMWEMVQLQTKLTLPQGEGSSCFVFEVKTPHPKQAFVDGKQKYGTYYAFHGSPVHNFHSIMHRGLLASLNTRSALGPGTYLSNAFATSAAYAMFGPGWPKSIFGSRLRCMAIVEVVDAPKGLKKHNYGGYGITNSSVVTVVTNDDWLQVTHLLLFAPEYFSNLHSRMEKARQKQMELRNNKKQVVVG